MDWETYYERFYDWAASTQISRMSSLTSFGPSSEVAEVAQNLMDEKAASRLIRKALSAGVRFTAEEISELSGCCDRAAMNTLLSAADCVFTQEQLEDLWGVVDDEVLALAAKRSRVALFDKEDDAADESEAAAPRLGFFAKLGLALGLSGALRGKTRPQRGHCTGDCASCPPHYGYRYGRWYYGHHHTHGCERGGNSGSGR